MKKGITTLFCIFLMLLSIQSNIIAKDLHPSPIKNTTNINFDRVMPTDIVAALNSFSTFNGSLSVDNENAKNLLTSIVLPSSMSIKTPKIDMNKVHDTNPLDEWQIENLKKHGYDDISITEMDAGIYYDIEKSWNLPSETIQLVNEFYPELDIKVISNWTWGDYFDYAKVADARANLYAPTEKQAAALNARNITLSDARMLLKDFYTYDSILEQSDNTLKECIEGYYQFTIDRINELAEISIIRESMSTKCIESVVAADPPCPAPPTNKQGSTYRYVNFEGYGNDWFHQDANTHDATTRASQRRAVIKGYNLLYNTSGDTFSAGNLWGTWSQSQCGAHEGIDFGKGVNTPIYSIAQGDVYYYSATSNAGILGIYDGTNTNFYLHMDTIKIGGSTLSGTVTDPSPKITVKTGDSVGTQGQKGNATGYHVHLEVEPGKTTGLSPEKNDDNLSSLNPYTAILKFTFDCPLCQ